MVFCFRAPKPSFPGTVDAGPCLWLGEVQPRRALGRTVRVCLVLGVRASPCPHSGAVLSEPMPRLTTPWALLRLGTDIHGPKPVSGETSDELSGPLVHTDIHGKQVLIKNKSKRNWSIRVFLEMDMDHWLTSLSESSDLHLHRSIECSSLLEVRSL